MFDWLDAIDTWLEPAPVKAPDFTQWYESVKSLKPNEIRPFLESTVDPFFEMAQSILQQPGFVERLEEDARIREQRLEHARYVSWSDWRSSHDK